MSSSGDSGTVSESVSGKSSPASFPDQNGHPSQKDVDEQRNKTNLEKTSKSILLTDDFDSEIDSDCHALKSGIASVIDTSSNLHTFLHTIQFLNTKMLTFCLIVSHRSILQIKFIR